MEADPNHTDPNAEPTTTRGRHRTRFAVANYRRAVTVARVYRLVVRV